MSVGLADGTRQCTLTPHTVEVRGKGKTNWGLSPSETVKLFLPGALALLATTSAGAAESNRETPVALDGKPGFPMHGTVAGFWLFGEDEGAQLAMLGHPPRRAVAALGKGRRITIRAAVDPVGWQGKPLVDPKHL